MATIVQRRPKACTTSGKKIHDSGCRPAGRLGDLKGADAQDHCADILGSGRFKEVGAAAGTVANVVADEVGNDGCVARIILRDTLLNLADKV